MQRQREISKQLLLAVAIINDDSGTIKRSLNVSLCWFTYIE